MKKSLFIAFFAILLYLLPYLSSSIHWDWNIPGYGLFPAQKVVEDPPFNQTYFNVVAFVGIIIILFLLFPQLFGFKKPTKPMQPNNPSVDFPAWFYPSLVVTLISWFFMWSRLDFTFRIDHFTFVPLWWGFILTIDGWVYKRNQGISLLSSRPNTMKLLAVVSSVCWFLFEFLNFFVLENWYYPNNQVFSNFGNIGWQLLSYSTVLPTIFEIYLLLRTFKYLDEKYKYGIKINLSNPILQWFVLLIGLGLVFTMGFFPFELFWVLWVAFIPVLVPAMNLKGFWNLFTPITLKGDYSFVVLVALSGLINGFFWEFWNFGSEWFHDYAPTNPNYWKYSIPYLDKYHIFSEMPLLGYLGYLCFGIVCWVQWLAVAYIFNFDPTISLNNEETNTKS